MDKTGNIVFLAEFRLDKARLRKARNGSAKCVPHPGEPETCTVLTLRDPERAPEIPGD